MPTLHCPICQRQIPYQVLTEVPHRPFCSRRCQLIDLGRWLNEEYRITIEPLEPDQPTEPPQAPDDDLTDAG